MALGSEIPSVHRPPPDQLYTYWRRSGNLLFLSGHGPRSGPEFKYKGKVGQDLTIQNGYAAARLTTLNLLQTIRDAVGSLDRVSQIVDVMGIVNSAPGFVEQSAVMNGCSECLCAIFGEQGKHTRMATGAAELPFNIAVEIKMIVEVH